jgi:uncharacterized DUF497 family protein
MLLYSVYTECAFEWDPRKAKANAAKHGITFDEAVTVFLDPDGLDGPDLQHSAAEGAIPSAWSIGRRTGAHGWVHAQEKWRCRSDPTYQRAAYTPKD